MLVHDGEQLKLGHHEYYVPKQNSHIFFFFNALTFVDLELMGKKIGHWFGPVPSDLIMTGSHHEIIAVSLSYYELGC